MQENPQQPESKEFTEKLFQFVDCAVPLYVAELLFSHLQKQGYNANVIHRDINKQ